MLLVEHGYAVVRHGAIMTVKDGASKERHGRSQGP